MTLQAFVVALLALAVMLFCARLLVAWRRSADARAWRWSLLLLAQPLLAVPLYFTLYPPGRPVQGMAAMTVLTEGATARDADDARAFGPVLALPEAGAIPGIERIADLGSALRRHPQARRVRVVGAGLAARDHDAARGVAIAPVFTPLPRGLRRLQAPEGVVAGGMLTVSGEAGGLEGGRVELLDPAGRRVDAAGLDGAGRFSLDGRAFAPGATAFTLRVLDDAGTVVDTVPVPLWVGDAMAPRVLLLAGAPNPETRALRRWMQDAGFELQARVALGAGMQLGNAPAPTIEALARIDMLVVDARAWNDLGDAGRARVMQAVDGGMGLLLRADTALAASALRPLRAQGFEIAGGASSSPFRIALPRLSDADALRARSGTGSADAPGDPAVAGEPLPELTRRAWRVTGTQAVSLLHDATGDAMAWWRPHGQGRIALWSPLDTWRLPLLGRRDLHADAWNAAFTVLARPQRQPRVQLQDEARVDARFAVCGVSDAASIEAPDGVHARLLPDPGARGCAAFWPTMPGWHVVRDGDDAVPFHVLAPDALPGVRLALLRDATARLAAMPVATGAAMTAAPPLATWRVSSWPWFAAWLLLAALLWWFERSRLGRTAA